MERLNERYSGGLTTRGLRIWGLLFAAAGIVGHSILQRKVLGVGTLTAMELLEAMNASDDLMIVATVALIMQVLETCAVPIFAFLLVEGFQHTSDFKNYFLRVLGVAVLSEIPYNLAMSGKVLDFESRNPAIGLVLGLLVLMLYKHYDSKSAANTFVKVIVAVAAVFWGAMLQLEPNGVCLVLVVCVLWVFRKNALYRNFAGAIATVVCCMVSPLFIAAPMGFLVVHFYNDQKGKDTSHVINYLAYPVLLLVAFVMGTAL